MTPSTLEIRKLGPVTLSLADQDRAVAEVCEAIATRSHRIFAFCNMHTFNLAADSPELAKALDQCTVFNDGIGMEVASKILCGEGFPANLNGTDLTPAVLAVLPPDTPVFLLGSPPGVAEVAGEALRARFPHLAIAGARHGYFGPDEEPGIADAIRASGARLVLVGMGNPQQELWAVRNAATTGAVVLCIGAYLDFASGRVSRAPRLVRALRCEWLYRMALEPGRLWRRYILGGGAFARHILAERAKHRVSTVA